MTIRIEAIVGDKGYYVSSDYSTSPTALEVAELMQALNRNIETAPKPENK